MNNSVLLNDFYQLSMAYGYWQRDMHNQDAVFHVFFRRNPLHGDYVVAAGLSSIVEFLAQFQFTDEDIDYLKSLENPAFPAEFLTYLKTLKFTGDIDAVPEGTIVFANEPLLRIRAPLLLCQLLETPLINAINFASSVATMASRIRTIVGNDVLFEFGLRRSQGPNGGLTASRSAFLGGFDATSNMLAGKQFDVPVVGTMSHSWVMAFDDELTAFQEYARIMPENIVLLVDTYNTNTGVDHAITLGKKLKGIRLDSGELGLLSKMARQKLDNAGLQHVKIFVSGDLTQDRIAELKSIDAPIDGWGVGTYLSTAYDQPTLDTVCKLGAIQKEGEWRYKLKRSDNGAKTSDPGILQVKRFYLEKKWVRDIIYQCDLSLLPSDMNAAEQSQDLLIPIFKKGVLLYTMPALIAIRAYCLTQVTQFNASKGAGYSVLRDARLSELKEKMLMVSK